MKFFYTRYSLRFIDIARVMNDSLDSLVDNLTRYIYNTKWKYCMKYLYKNLVKKLSDYRLDHNKTCEDCKWYLEYTEVRKNTLFLSVKGLKKR